MHEGRLGILLSQVLEADSSHCGGMIGAGDEIVVFGVFEGEVIKNHGLLCCPGEYGKDVFRLEGEEVGDEAQASIVAKREEGVKAFFCL